MYIYKFRAECKQDLIDLLQEVVEGKMMKCSFEHQLMADEKGVFLPPDIEVEISFLQFTLDQLKTAMKKVLDGHVMWQTVQPIEKYTGERKY